MTTFSSLNLSAPLAESLEISGYTTPTPIQAQAIPLVMQGKDLMGIAQTGTGKTAAFALPILDHIIRKDIIAPKRGTRVLVLAPTRELASQIAVSFRGYGQAIEGLKVQAIYGGVKAQRQIQKTVLGNDVLVATPGRLLDLIDQKALRLSDVEILVLDEADQMMDMGFIHALRKIVPMVPKNRQTLFFSATMSPAITKLAKQFLTNPERVSVAPANTTAERVEQQLTFVNQGEKQALLTLALSNPDIDRALVFTRTKHGADRVVKKLRAAGLESVAIHGNKSQSQRQRALEAFKSGDIRFMIATDVAARGIDIEGISHVINFEIPNVAEQYVHRIGRTGRAGRAGVAVSYVAPDEKPYLKDIQKLLKMTIPVTSLPENFNAEVARVGKLKPVPKPQAVEGTPKKKKKQRPGKWERDGKKSGKKDGGNTDAGNADFGNRNSDNRNSANTNSDNRNSENRNSGNKNNGNKNRAPHAKSERSSKPKWAPDMKEVATAADPDTGGRTFNRKPRPNNRRNAKPGEATEGNPDSRRAQKKPHHRGKGSSTQKKPSNRSRRP